MKTIKHLIIAASVSALFMSSALALPAGKSGQAWETIQKKSDVEQLGPKPQLVLVCKSSNTVTLIEIKDEKQAKELCSEGKMLECKDCKKHYKVIWKNPTGKNGGPELKMDIVNAKGESCMFLAKIK
jgi:murein L,D-transpeptidase YafK